MNSFDCFERQKILGSGSGGKIIECDSFTISSLRYDLYSDRNCKFNAFWIRSSAFSKNLDLCFEFFDYKDCGSLSQDTYNDIKAHLVATKDEYNHAIYSLKSKDSEKEIVNILIHYIIDSEYLFRVLAKVEKISINEGKELARAEIREVLGIKDNY